ncbi:phage tail protein, partial [Staphylococcus agnetis]
MIHILNFNDEIIDFISRSDNAVTRAKYERDKSSEILDLVVLSKRAEHFKKRNRVIIQDINGVYREFIIERTEEDGKYLQVECTASYVSDISTAKPIMAGKYEKMTVNQKLSEVLRDTNWSVGDCDYGGIRTNSWTSPRTPYEMISQLTTNHKLEPDYEIIIEGNEVKQRLVNMKIPSHLFKGKEIVYGKDLLSIKRTVDYSEVKTALIGIGPEKENGERIFVEEVDDEAQQQFNLPQRYIYGIYEPETEDDNMTLERLRTLTRTELNKRKSAAISYEISVVDLEKEYPHEIIRFGDIVRIKNPDFTPSLYAESEVIGFKHDLISGNCTYTFGNIIEYKEETLRKYFESKLDYIRQKLNDGLTNVNTIVEDVVEGKLEYFERKIIKGVEPPENPVNDMLWLDTSNPDVAVLRRYWEGQWINATAEKAEDIGAITREKALYSELNNTFVNLSIQHSKLLNEMHDVMNSEYLVDFDLKEELNTKLGATVSIYNNIKTNLESMTDETATIGKLIDIQSLFLNYRTAMQELYTVVERAKIAIDNRFKLLQSQYTDEKFNEALNHVAEKLGLTVNEDNKLIGEIDVSKQIDESVREVTKQMLRDYVTSSQYQSDKQGIIERLESSDSERKQLANKISDTVTKSEYENDVKQKLSASKAEVLIEAERTSNRVSKEVFDASSQTLNRVVSEFINNTTSGMTFTYDENGNIQSQNIGPQGIKFDATKFEINDGDVVVKNGRTTIKDAYIDKLFSNQATINKLNS